MRTRKIKEQTMRLVFLLSALVSVLAVALICLFLFVSGVPAMREIGVLNFLFGTRWKPSQNVFGIFPMILGSLYVTAGAVVLGVPVGILTALFLARFCPKRLYKILKPATELHREALIATAVVRFVFILAINVCFSLLRRRTHQ